MKYKPEYRIEVDVETHYLPEESDPENSQYVFSYTITIHNAGTLPARLLSRHWVIENEVGKIQEVYGPGVIGEHPYLKPSESFRYTSGTRIDSPIGRMHGSYQMIADDQTCFDAEISPFILAAPRILH